jgi:predicted ATPase/DNA-binding CsgD family transcriptional regulator
MSAETSFARGNLPAEPNRFIGRERDLAELALLLTDVRVLTLCGTGGIGKTRLALRLSADAAEGFPDGAWLVGLADVTTPEFVMSRTAAALGVREEPGQPLKATLADALRGQRLLLILDNCEHVVTACAQLCEYLLASCPWLRVITTSREPLRMPGETVWRVPPLSVPPASAPEHELGQHEAVRLFTERAAAVRPGFSLDRGNATSIAGVCRTLDGMPLAIELAAARVGALAVEQINGRLTDRFQLLAGGHRTAPARQRTLRATVDWSYELLTEPQQILLRRLAVFSGWNLEMAEKVCADDALPAESILDLLAALIDKSLVTMHGEVAGHARYRLLDTIRQYAAERLAASGEADRMHRRHRDCMIELVEDIVAKGFRRGDPPWEWRLSAYKQACMELDNFRAALKWSRQENEPEVGLRLCIALRSPWVTDGDVAEGASWLDRFLGGDGDYVVRDPVVHDPIGPGSAVLGSAVLGSAVLGRALVVRSELAFEAQEYQTAQRCAQAGLEESRRRGDDSFAAGALRVLASVELRLGDAAHAHELAGDAVKSARAAGDYWEEGRALGTLAAAAAHQGRIREAQRTYDDALDALKDNNRWGVAHVRYGMAMLAQARGDHEGSLVQLDAALDIFRELDSRPEIARCLAALGRVAMAQQDYAAARPRLVESLRLSRATGQRLAVARGLEAFAQLAAFQGQHARAVRLGGAARSLRAAIGASPVSPGGPGSVAHDGPVGGPRETQRPPGSASAGGLGGRPPKSAEGARLERLLEPARRQLGEQTTAALLAEGERLTMAEGAEYAVLAPDADEASSPVPPAAAARPQPADPGAPGFSGPAPPGSVLTPREWEIAELIARGLSNRAIATELVISPATAARHVANILTKLGFSSRAQVAAWITARREPRDGAG